MDPMMQDPAMQEPMMEEPMMEESLMDETPDDLMQSLSDGISDYLHGPARDHLATALSSPEGALEDTIAATAYQTLTEVSKQIAQMDPGMVTIDILMPLATETIDYLIEMAHAVGSNIPDEQELRETSFIKMIEIHLSNPEVTDDPEQRAIAEEYLAEMVQDGSYDEAERYINEKIKAEGGTPEQTEQMAMQMLQPKQDPLAQGVQQGLMDMGGGM